MNVFDDEFDGTALDQTKWEPDRYGQDYGGDTPFNTAYEDAWFGTSNVTVSNGTLQLTIKQEPKTLNGKTYPYSSGVVQSAQHFMMKPGSYVEASINVPKCDGCWPAFWEVPQNAWPPEIDNFEFFGTQNADQSRPYFNYHMPSTGGQTGPKPYGESTVDYRGSFHTYGLLWDGTQAVPYLDGKAYGNVAATQDMTRLDMAIILNLSVQSGHKPPAGSQMKVDWLRVWQPGTTTDAAPAPVPAPVAGFTASVTSGIAPLTVNFTNTSTGTPTTNAWNFGDNSTSTETNPSHTYTQPGTYTVSLTSTNATGSNTKTQTGMITVNAPAPTQPIATTPTPPTTGSATISAATSSSAVSTSARSTVTLTKPAGTISGDVLVASFTADHNPDATAPTGWTSLTKPITLNNGATLFSYYHVVTSNDDRTSSWTWPLSSSQKWGGGMTRYTGVDTSAPLAAPVVTNTDLSWTAESITAPSLTTSTPGALLISGLGIDAGNPAPTAPSGWTENWNSTGGQVTAQASKPLTSTGATGPQTWQLNRTLGSAIWMTALRPATG